MNQNLIITDDGFTYWNNKVTHTSRLAQSIFNSYRPAMNLLPRALRWFSNDGTAFLIERPPQILHMLYPNGKDVCKIHIPWTVFLIKYTDESLKTLDSVKVFARVEPIQSMHDELYRLPLPGIATDGTLLDIGDLIELYKNQRNDDIFSEQRTVAFKLQAVIAYFTSLRSIRSSGSQIYDALACLTLMRWEKLTKSEVLNLDWQREVSGNVGEICAQSEGLKKEDLTFELLMAANIGKELS